MCYFVEDFCFADLSYDRDSAAYGVAHQLFNGCWTKGLGKAGGAIARLADAIVMGFAIDVPQQI